MTSWGLKEIWIEELILLIKEENYFTY